MSIDTHKKSLEGLLDFVAEKKIPLITYKINETLHKCLQLIIIEATDHIQKNYNWYCGGFS